MNEEEIDEYIMQFSLGNELGELRQIEDEEAKPWEKKKADSKLNRSDIPNEIHITKANLLYIEKNGFANKALNKLKRLAAFRNPDFYKAQAMRLPTFDKPRIISLSDETPDYLCLPRGCEIDFINLLSFGSSEESIMRLDSINIANELIGTIEEMFIDNKNVL